MQTDHVAVRLRVDLIERIDALIPLLSTIGHDAKRSDVLRALIVTALADVEADPTILTARPTATPAP